MEYKRFRIKKNDANLHHFFMVELSYIVFSSFVEVKTSVYVLSNASF